MADHQPHHVSPLDLNVHDPQFRRKAVLQMFEIRRDFEETIAATKNTIETSKELLEQADRMLAQK